MKAQVKPPEGLSSVPESDAPAQRLFGVESAADAQPPSGEAEQAPGRNSVKTPRKEALIRLVVTLILVGIAGAGYLQRERVLKLIRPPDANQSSARAEATQPVAGDFPEGVFRITPEKQQLIGVKYGEVGYKPVSKTLRAVGRVAYDETKITRIHPKVEGWIEQVFVDFTGKQVKEGQPLISVYSPELWQTQQEYLLARTGHNELAKSPFREAVAGSESLLQAARKRLELWDVGDEQIEHL